MTEDEANPPEAGKISSVVATISDMGIVVLLSANKGIDTLLLVALYNNVASTMAVLTLKLMLVLLGATK